jgi:hypothetical protein
VGIDGLLLGWVVDKLLKLKDKAKQLGVTPADLMRVSIEEQLARPDDAFEDVVAHVPKKHASLCGLLARCAVCP